MVEFDKENFLKESKQLAGLAKDVIRELLDLHNSERGIPNVVVLNDNQLQFNIQMSELVKNLRVNFSIYEAGINAYLLDLTSFIPQEDYSFPPDSTPETLLFKVTGGPALGAHSLQKPISALSIGEATEGALEYVYDHMEDIMKEILGGEGL